MRWLRAPPGPLHQRAAASTAAAATTTTPPGPSDPSLGREVFATEEALSILHHTTPIEPPLDSLSSLLSPHSVYSVLLDSPPHLSFRFFIWSSHRRRLRSWLSHNLIISILRQTPTGFASAWSSLHDLRDSRVPISSPAFSVLISAYAASGMEEKAVEAFAKMKEFDCKPDTFTYNTLLRVLVEKGVGLLAVSLYTHMIKSDCRPNRATFAILVDGLCKSGKTDEALELFDEMLQRGIRPNTMIHTVFLVSFCRLDRLDEALRLFESLRKNNYKLDAAVHNALLSGFCKAGRIDEAFEQLRSFEQDGNFTLGVHGYSYLIDGLFRAGRFDEACRHYDELLEKKLVPDCVLYTIMIRGYSEAGRIGEAFAFLSEMTDRGLVPDTFCYNTLIKSLCDAGLLDRARSLRLEISQHNQFPDSTTYTIMICGLCNEGLVSEAQQIFDEMGKFGCVPTIMTFNSLINGLCKAGRLEEAQILFYKMEMGRKPSLFLRLSQGADRVRDTASLRKLIDELCQEGQLLKAYKLLRDIIESGVVPDIVTYNILINGFCKEGNRDGALKLFKELQLKGHTPDEFTYGTLIDGLLKVHREEDSLMVFQHMLRSGYAPSLSICSTLMRTLCRKRKVSQAVILWLNRISHESSIPREAEAVRVAREHFEQGCTEEAVRALIEMETKQNRFHSFPYTIWLIGYCQLRKGDEALKIFSILMEFNIDVTPPGCVLLINRLCWERKLASALDVMLYALRKGFVLMQPVGNRLLKRLCMQNKKKEACELAERMSLAGYDMDVYLRTTTKALLYDN